MKKWENAEVVELSVEMTMGGKSGKTIECSHVGHVGDVHGAKNAKNYNTDGKGDTYCDGYSTLS